MYPSVGLLTHFCSSDPPAITKRDETRQKRQKSQERERERETTRERGREREIQK